MQSRVVLLGSVLLLAACSLDRVSIAGAPGDAGSALDAGLDAGPIDAGSTTDAGVDSGVIAEVDSGVDAGQDGGQDAGVDAGQDAGPPPLRTCDEIYGMLGETVELCEQRPTECEFYVEYSSDVRCSTICEEVGGRCLHAYNDSGGHCSRARDDNCMALLRGQICICTRIP